MNVEHDFLQVEEHGRLLLWLVLLLLRFVSLIAFNFDGIFFGIYFFGFDFFFGDLLFRLSRRFRFRLFLLLLLFQHLSIPLLFTDKILLYPINLLFSVF
jgi:hypothetical protein